MMVQLANREFETKGTNQLSVCAKLSGTRYIQGKIVAISPILLAA